MLYCKRERRGERGAATVEFALVGAAFFTMLFAVAAGGVYYAAHNGLVEATRRGARYAATKGKTAADNALTRKVAVYGNEAGTGQPIAPNLTTANIAVRHSGLFGVGKGTVSVAICSDPADDEDGACTPYTYNFVIPGFSKAVSMPAYRTTVAGESAGYAP